MTENDRQARNIVNAAKRHMAGTLSSEELVRYILHDDYVHDHSSNEDEDDDEHSSWWNHCQEDRAYRRAEQGYSE